MARNGLSEKYFQKYQKAHLRSRRQRCCSSLDLPPQPTSSSVLWQYAFPDSWTATWKRLLEVSPPSSCSVANRSEVETCKRQKRSNERRNFKKNIRFHFSCLIGGDVMASPGKELSWNHWKVVFWRWLVLWQACRASMVCCQYLATSAFIMASDKEATGSQEVWSINSILFC